MKNIMEERKMKYYGQDIPENYIGTLQVCEDDSKLVIRDVERVVKA